MRRLFRLVFLIIVGLVVGTVGYEAIMLVRVAWLRSHNPSSTSLIDTRIREAEANGKQPRREQVWVPLEKISTNLQRAVLAGEDTNFLTHRGFDYEAIQKAFEQAQREAAREAEGEDDDWLRVCRSSNAAVRPSPSNWRRIYISHRSDRFCERRRRPWLTVMIERTMTKRRILEIYLNVIEWGDGVYGAEAASQRYFRNRLRR
jgi:monofunctional biosynthetic peptidoglycan transglycosylase